MLAFPRPARRIAFAGRLNLLHGFTLLELLLVLTLVALLSGLVVPRVWGWVDSARQRAALDQIRSLLLQQPTLAFHAGQRRELTGDEPEWALPAGWRVELRQPLVWQADGMASGGRLRLHAGRTLLADWVIEPLGGGVREATAADATFPVDAMTQ